MNRRILFQKLNTLFFSLLLSLAIFSHGSLFAQSKNSCLTLFQLQQLHQGGEATAHIQFNRNYWIQGLNGYNIPFSLTTDTLHFDVMNWRYTADFSNTQVNIYYDNQHNTIVEYKTGSECFTNLFDQIRSDTFYSMQDFHDGTINRMLFENANGINILFVKVNSTDPMFSIFVGASQHIGIPALLFKQPVQATPLVAKPSSVEKVVDQPIIVSNAVPDSSVEQPIITSDVKTTFSNEPVSDQTTTISSTIPATETIQSKATENQVTNQPQQQVQVQIQLHTPQPSLASSETIKTDSSINELRHSLEAEMQKRKDFESQMITKEKLESVIDRADSASREKIVEQLMSSMESSYRSLFAYNEMILNKIDGIQENFKASRIDVLTNIGESLYGQEQYTAANVVFNEILALDPNNANAKVRVRQTDEKSKIMLVRSSRIYDYKQLSPNSYRAVIDQLRQELNRYPTLYPSGKLAFNFNIRVDTLGFNRTTYLFEDGFAEGKSKRRIRRDFSYFLHDLSKSQHILPTSKENILVAAKADLQIDMSWVTRSIKFRSNDVRFKIKSDSEYPRDIAAVNSYLDRNDHSNGKYTFEVRQKTLDKMVFTDIDLVKFHTVGPEAMIYSMIIPGSGNMAATQGQKGWGAFSGFLLFGSATVVTYCLSKDQAKKADKYDPDSPEYKKHSNNSKFLKYGSYATVGVAGVIYISDVVTALVRGIRNMKDSKELRKALKTMPIDIQRESVLVY